MTDLPVHTTQRGFDFHTPVPSEYGGHIAVSESSAADGPHIWVRAVAPADLNNPDGPTREAPIHLTADNAWLLARQLAALVVGHYHGDARPASAVADARTAVAEVLGSDDPAEVQWTLDGLARRGFVLIHVGEAAAGQVSDG